MGKPSAGAALRKAWKRYVRQLKLYYLPHLLTASFVLGAVLGWIAHGAALP